MAWPQLVVVENLQQQRDSAGVPSEEKEEEIDAAIAKKKRRKEKEKTKIFIYFYSEPIQSSITIISWPRLMKMRAGARRVRAGT